MTALEAQIAPDLAATDVADDAAPDEADRAGDEDSRDGTYGRVSHPPCCARSRGRGDNSGSDEGKSTKRSH
jgi:hypothetical protein